MIKINLVREGRAVRGTGVVTSSASAVSGPTNLNNVFLVTALIAGVIVAGMHTNEIFIENGRFHGHLIARSIAERISI